MGRKSKIQIEREKELALMRKKQNKYIPLELLAIDVKLVAKGKKSKKTVGFLVHPYKKGHVLKHDFKKRVDLREALEIMGEMKKDLVMSGEQIKADMTPAERRSMVAQAKRGRGKVEGYEYHEVGEEEEEEE